MLNYYILFIRKLTQKDMIMKNIIITGASSGIGKALKEHYRKKGNRVFDISRTIDDKVDSFSCDVSDKTGMVKVFETIAKQVENIDILINCAGFGLSGAIELIPTEKIQAEYDVNVIGSINAIQLALPLMSKKGKIINISSACALFPLPYRAFYCSSKAAVSMLSDCLRMELCQTKIQSTAICPCDIKTNFTKNRVKNYETNERYGETIRLSAERIDSREDKRMSLEKAIKIMVKIIDKKKLKPEYVMGARNKFMNFVQRFFPKSWRIKVLTKIFYTKEKK